MSVLVKDWGFVPEDWTQGYVPLWALSDHPGGAGVDLRTPEIGARDWARLCALLPELGLVRIELRHFADVAALDLARAIRAEGYAGRLRAHGAVLAGLYTLTRRAGFDEIELDRDQARLQPAEHWRFEASWSPARRGGDRPEGARSG